MFEKGIFISTELVEPYIQNDFWREITRPYAEILIQPNTPKGTLNGSLQSILLGGDLMVSKTTFNSQNYRRSQSQIQQGGLEFFTLQIITQGTMQGNFGTRNINVSVGDICIVDMVKTFENQVVGDGARIAVCIPRKSLEKVFGNQNLHGLVLKAKHPITGILTNLIIGLFNIDKSLKIHEINSINDAIVSLLTAGITNSLKESPETIMLLNSTIYNRAINFIEANIQSPQLTPSVIQQALRISRAHLYRAFIHNGGIAKTIRDKRLDMAYKELTSIQPPRSISQLAYDCGFSSSDQFLRAFRSRFSMTPSEAKAQQDVFLPNTHDIYTLYSYFKNFKNAR
ncbi:helix-turn-helix domain-containing protein [Acinetobacter lactucae]|uniref:helix-turn-helix domain-containing protein n=1 Tax=Acinetobacter lactucae TaxID=1785128 RepID=UPI00358DC27B